MAGGSEDRVKQALQGLVTYGNSIKTQAQAALTAVESNEVDTTTQQQVVGLSWLAGAATMLASVAFGATQEILIPEDE